MSTIDDELLKQQEEEEQEREQQEPEPEGNQGNEADNNGNGNGKGEKDKDKKHYDYVQKYSETGLLAEAVIVGGIHYFAVSQAGNITLKKSISIDDTSEYKPFEHLAYLNEPYRFQSEQDFKSYIDRARHETLDTLYRKVKAIWSKYIDADDFHISICAADTIFTYYQDKMGLTHYLFFVGGNDSGKSNNLSVLKYLAYRNFTTAGMTAPNVYQFLGSGEEGQGTLCCDEADKIDEDRLMMAILKNGYRTGFPVPKIDTSFGRKQLKFNTYCFKAFAAERFLDPVTAKGLIQRIIELQCDAGDPEYDIAEVIDETGAEDFQNLKDELNDMRNLLLVFRLVHFHDKIPNVKLNIKRREKQLFKPVIRIFQNSKTLDELLPVISKYVTQKREANSNSQHAFLYEVARDIIKSRKTPKIESSFIWNYIRDNLQGVDIPGKPLSYDSSEFGTISQKEIILIYEHIFGAKTKKTNGIRNVHFNIPKLERLGRIYDLATEVRVVRDGDDSFEQNRGSDWTDWTDIGLVKYLSSGNGDAETPRTEYENKDISNNDGGKHEDIIPNNQSTESPYPVHPPDPPHPTLSSTAEAGVGIGIGAYRLGQSDTFACHNCKMRGDKWFMEGHQCNGKGKRSTQEVK